MKKFRKLLTEKDIAWIDSIHIGVVACPIYRTNFTFKNIEFSVINGYGTYGGYDPFTDSNEGLLEIFDSETSEAKGNFTAAEAMKYTSLIAENAKKMRNAGTETKDIALALSIIAKKQTN